MARLPMTSPIINGRLSFPFSCTVMLSGLDLPESGVEFMTVGSP